jgi:ribonuclease HI
MMVLNEEADRLGLEVPNPQICTLKLSRQNFLLERYNLLAVARFLGVENLHKKHRAYKDAYVLHKIFEKILLNLPKKIDTTEKIINFKRGEKQLFSAEFYDINLNKKLNYRGFFDGASAGNPGRMGTGFAIFDKKEQLIFEHSEYIGIGTNNEAEYQAFIFLLEFATLNKIENLEIFGDSKLVIMQVTGQWKVKAENLRPYVIKAKKLIEQIPNCSIKWIARDKNSVADKLSKDGVNASDEYEY